MGAFKLLPCFPLDIDVNDILNYRKNDLLCKCRKKSNRVGLLEHLDFVCSISGNYNNIIFEKFLEILLDNNVTLRAQTLVNKASF